LESGTGFQPVCGESGSNAWKMILPLMILPKSDPHRAEKEKGKIINGQNDSERPRFQGESVSNDWKLRDYGIDPVPGLFPGIIKLFIRKNLAGMPDS
jgi:hypothetical protein